MKIHFNHLLKRLKILALLLVLFFATQIEIISAQTINPDRIQIARDSVGTPHIFAPTDAEAAYGLAWAQSEDQFPKIQSLMLMTRARGGETIGVPGVAVDYFVHFIRARKIVEERYETDLSPEYRKIVEAYAAGLTAYAAAHPKDLLLPDLLPFTGKDVVTGYVITLAMFVGAPSALQFIFAGKPDDYIFGGSVGSNAYAANARLLDEGYPFLCMNPHIPLQGPVTWYEAHLVSGEGLNIMGGFFPGTPTPGLGTNPNLGWGMTFNWPDFVDIYKLKIDPQNKNCYLLDGQSIPFEITRTPLKSRLAFGKKSRKALYKDWWKPSEVKSCAPKIGLKWKFRNSRLGPVVKTRKGYFAVRVASEKMVKAPEQWYKMAKARNFTEFKNALKIQGVPLFNIVYADKYDTIFYYFGGAFPERDPRFNWQKVLPGETSDVMWKRYLPVDSLPQVLNPACGYVYNTNSTPFHATCDGQNLDSTRFSTAHAFSWNRSNNRALRFRELTKDVKKQSYARWKAFKYDDTYPATGGFMRTLSAFQKLETGKYPSIADAILVLRYWNRRGGLENTGAALAQIANYYLEIKLKLDLAAIENGVKVSEKNAVWALKKAKRFLIRNFKTIRPEWGKVQILERGKKSWPVAGMPDALLAAQGVLKNGKLRVRFGDTYTQFVKFKPDGPEIESIVPFGSSDNPDSPHFDDQAKRYAARQTNAPRTLDIQTIRKAAVRIYSPK